MKIDGSFCYAGQYKQNDNNFPCVILASKSLIRKRLLANENISFEVIVSNADETPDENKSFKDQLAEISMRKAQKVFEKTKKRGRRVIIAADQNIVFESCMYGKPKTIEEARTIIKKMMGSEEIYAYTGNTVLLADKDNILQSINVTDIARMSMDELTDKELEDYLQNSHCLSCCGGINILKSNFIHLKEGRKSTASGMTTEYAKELIKNLK